MKRSTYKIMMALTLMLGGVSFAHAGFIGRELSVEYFYTDLSTPYPPAVETPSTFQVANGIETQVIVEGVTTIAVDVSDASILFDFSTLLNSPTWGSAAFNGLVFNVLAGAPLDFISFSIDPSSTFAGFDSSRVSFNDSQVTVNWQGLSYNSDTMLLINFEQATAEVSEPASLSLLGLGFLSAAAMRRRRFTITETQRAS